jgi:hypothetical protein
MAKNRDIILTINVVEKPLVRAVNLHSKAMGIKLKGLVLVHREYAKLTSRPKDTSGLFKEIICDFNDPNELQTVLKPYTDRLLAVTCRYEEAIQPFGQVIPFLPYLYTPSSQSLVWATEKPQMRDRLSNYDTSLSPRYQQVEEEDLPNLHSMIKGFEFPVIIKPSGLAKALFVTRCDTKSELEDNLENVFQLIHEAYAREQYPGKPSVLVEEMMQGDMFSIDSYVSHDGTIQNLPPMKVITAHSVGLPGFYGCQITTQTGLSKSDIEAAFETTTSAIRALNLSSTTTHAELFKTPHGWKIIEVAARIGGHRDYLYREAYGIEHFYNDLLVRMGKEPLMPKGQIGHAAAINIYAKSEGIIKTVEGLEAARNLDSYVYLDQNAHVGDLALFAGNGGDAIIDGVLSNKDPQKLQQDLKKVRNLIDIQIASQADLPMSARAKKRSLQHISS